MKVSVACSWIVSVAWKDDESVGGNDENEWAGPKVNVNDENGGLTTRCRISGCWSLRPGVGNNDDDH